MIPRNRAAETKVSATSQKPKIAEGQSNASYFSFYAPTLKAHLLQAFAAPHATGENTEDKLAYIWKLQHQIALYENANGVFKFKQETLLTAMLDDGLKKFASLEKILARARKLLHFHPLGMPDNTTPYILDKIILMVGQKGTLANVPTTAETKIEAKETEIKVEQQAHSLTPSIPLLSFGHQYFFNKPDLQRQLQEQEKINKLFQHLCRGEQKDVQAILEEAKNRGPEFLINLLSTRHTITDHASRQFDNITLLQLSLWYLDRHMWTMLLGYFRDESVKNALLGVAYEQYLEHASGQTQYVKEHGPHYNFEGERGVVTALQQVADFFNSLPRADFTGTPEQWATLYQKLLVDGTGKAYAQAPLHVIHELFQEGLEYASSKLEETRFKEEKLTRTVEFQNRRTGNNMSFNNMSFWAALKSGLGSTFTLFRSEYYEGQGDIDPKDETTNKAACFVVVGMSDFKAMHKLYQARTNDYKVLGPELKNEYEAELEKEQASDLLILKPSA